MSCCGARKFARPIWKAAGGGKSSNGAAMPDGQITAFPVQPQFEKYFAFAPGRNTFNTPAVPSPIEGRFAIVMNVGCGMRWTWVASGAQIACWTKGASADGEAVWS